MENISNDFATTLNGGIDATQTSLTVVSSTGAPAVNFRIKIDSELMLVTSLGTGLNWTVQRNIEGTTGASHLTAVVVAHVITKGGLDEYGFENMTAFYPGARSGEVKTVGTSMQLNVFEELLIDGGELIVDGGNINLMALP